MKQLWNGIRLAAVAAGAIGLAAGTAGAQVNFQGNTTGCFFTSSTPTSCPTGTATIGSLSYTGATFNVNSNPDDGLVSIGAAPGTPNVNNLGSFTLHDGDYNYTGQNFALFMNFTNPAGATGNNMYTAMIQGNLTNATTGNVFINFDNTQHEFTFADGTTLDFTVEKAAVSDNNPANSATVAVTGHGFTQTSTVPEPSSLALLGTGLIGLVPLARRRRNG